MATILVRIGYIAIVYGFQAIDRLLTCRLPRAGSPNAWWEGGTWRAREREPMMGAWGGVHKQSPR